MILRYTKGRGGALTIKLPAKMAAGRSEVLKAIEGLLP